MIEASAPGKVVLWGEYAVLAGAPALVMAVDRYARCRIDTGRSEGWRFSARGFEAPDHQLPRAELLAAGSPPRAAVSHLAWHVLHTLKQSASIDTDDLPADAEVRLDTTTFHHNGHKLGLGSSAALCVAAYGAFSRLLGQPPSYAFALEIHQRFQGATGSGIDVAAAWHGGQLKFRRPERRGTNRTGGGEPTPWTLPEAIRLSFVFAGEPASTTDRLERLQRWRDGGGGTELEDLGAASTALFEADDLMGSLTDYVAALEALDRAARLGIYSESHQRLTQLAIDAGVVYKPCGAGGGDIGAAFTPDAGAAERFRRRAADNGFLPLALETASHGIEVTG